MPPDNFHSTQLMEKMADESPVRFGIIGCAEIARKVSRAIDLAPNATLQAVASRSIEKAQQFASENRLPETVKIYGSYNQVLDDPSVDAVYMPLPTSLHARWAVLAAQKKKHLLLEKPTALDVVELDRILDACKSNGVQFMDGSMWYHHPRTPKMKRLISDSRLFGQLRSIHSTSTFMAGPEFLEKDIRVKPDLDTLGALGDSGWYCIAAILWAMNHQPPATVVASPAIDRNSAGVILSCTASLHWENNNNKEPIVATFHCSFLSHLSMGLALYGSRGSLHAEDFIIPYEESSASFDFASGAEFVDRDIGWNVKPEKVEVGCHELPQEALMVREFAGLVKNVRDSKRSPDGKWAEISRMTQLVMDAVKKSIDLGFQPVCL